MHAYKYAIELVEIAVVYLIFAHGNRFDNAKNTAWRAFGAVIVGWQLVFVSSMLITDIDLMLARSQEEMIRISNGDGARHIGALLLGWIYPLVWIGIIWVVCRVVKLVRARNMVADANQ